MNRYLHVLPHAEALAEAAAAHWVERARAAITTHERFAVALSGGKTPQTLYRHLAQARDLSWEQVWIFFGDERCVPADHPDSNYRMARETLLHAVPVAHVYPMNCVADPARAAENYSALLAPLQPAADLPPVLDLILLGLGVDGHTASLFPDGSAVTDTTHWVAPVLGHTPDHPRLTLTLPTINAAREVMFVVSGRGKAGVVRAVLDARQDLPAAHVAPSGDVHWFLDEAAAESI